MHVIHQPKYARFGLYSLRKDNVVAMVTLVPASHLTAAVIAMCQPFQSCGDCNGEIVSCQQFHSCSDCNILVILQLQWLQYASHLTAAATSIFQPSHSCSDGWHLDRRSRYCHDTIVCFYMQLTGPFQISVCVYILKYL